MNLREIFPGIPPQDVPQYNRDGGSYTACARFTKRRGVPAGNLSKHGLEGGAHYPGVRHDFWVYVPHQYRGDEPANVMVFLDGEAFLGARSPTSPSMPTLLDNMIHDRDIPVTIGVFINPGQPGPGYPIYGGSGNRSIEYDVVGPSLADFITDKILAQVGQAYHLTGDPDCRGVVGASSGGCGAFGIAWHRPDAFRKVISAIGSFVDIRGAHVYPFLIRQSPTKPIRVFLQDGRNDLDTIFGNWPLANEQMASALAYRGYDHIFAVGDGGHNLNHINAVFGEAMQWLWRDAR